MQLYLIRHGQAGTRTNYDVLSETGRKQAGLLGQYFRSAGIRFDVVWSGALRRQRETAAIVLDQMEAGSATVDERWNEFSLEGLWDGLAPMLLEADEEFQRLHRMEHSDPNGTDRVTTRCDIHLIRHWVERRYRSADVEAWDEFRRRVMAPLETIQSCGSGQVAAVFTSATPTAIWCGSALGIENAGIFRIAGVLQNSSFSTLRVSDGGMTLFSLNNVPHLLDPALRTFR